MYLAAFDPGAEGKNAIKFLGTAAIVGLGAAWLLGLGPWSKGGFFGRRARHKKLGKYLAYRRARETYRTSKILGPRSRNLEKYSDAWYKAMDI